MRQLEPSETRFEIVRMVLLQPKLSPTGDNRRAVTSALGLPDPTTLVQPGDLVVLPEHWYLGTDPEPYLATVRELVIRNSCTVIGGSHHATEAGVRYNRGVVCGPNGEEVLHYDKLRPYGVERSRVAAGTHYGSLVIEGMQVLVLLCADFWFIDLIQRAPQTPDLIVVPALSVSRKARPEFSQRLWQHMAISRAYELACYVGVADWAFDEAESPPRASGVAGFADPTQTDPDEMFTPVSGNAQAFELSRERLLALRADRRAQGFLWRTDG